MKKLNIIIITLLAVLLTATLVRIGSDYELLQEKEKRISELEKSVEYNQEELTKMNYELEKVKQDSEISENQMNLYKDATETYLKTVSENMNELIFLKEELDYVSNDYYHSAVRVETSTTLLDLFGNPVYQVVIGYNSEDLMVFVQHIEDGETYKTDYYKYGNSDLIKGSSSYDINGELIERGEYTYNGNLLTKIEYYSESNLLVRSLHYVTTSNSSTLSHEYIYNENSTIINTIMH